MRRFLVFSVGILLVQLIAVAAFAQETSPPKPAAQTAPKGLEGRWTGSINTPNGDMDMAATFKKDKDAYTGTITGMQGDIAFKSVKVDGDKVKAQAEFETPNGNIVVNYSFTLKDDTLKGKGEVDFGGQNMAFDINLKRAAEK